MATPLRACRPAAPAHSCLTSQATAARSPGYKRIRTALHLATVRFIIFPAILLYCFFSLSGRGIRHTAGGTGSLCSLRNAMDAKDCGVCLVLQWS